MEPFGVRLVEQIVADDRRMPLQARGEVAPERSGLVEMPRTRPQPAVRLATVELPKAGARQAQRDDHHPDAERRRQIQHLAKLGQIRLHQPPV